MTHNLLPFLRPVKASILACGLLFSINASAKIDFTGFNQVNPTATDGSEYLFEGTFHDYDFTSSVMLFNFLMTEWTGPASDSPEDEDSEESKFSAILNSLPLVPPTKKLSCSEVRKGDFFGRNLDGYYNDYADLIMHVDAREDRLASLATGQLQFIGTKDNIKNGIIPDVVMNLAPMFVNDGVNEAGVCVSLNALPFYNVPRTSSTKPGAPRLCEFIIPRLILDKAHNVDEALELIKSYDLYAPYNAALDLYHELKFIIADSESTAIVEILDNKIRIGRTYNTTEVNDGKYQGKFYNPNIMTNSWSFSYEYEDEEGNIQNSDEEEKLGLARCGNERYMILKENYDATPTSVDGMYGLMQKAWYSQGLPKVWRTDLNWTTEWNYMKDITQGRGKEVYEYGKKLSDMFSDAATPQLLTKYRSPLLEATVHTSVYDMKNKTLLLVPEESDSKYNFVLEQK